MLSSPPSIKIAAGNWGCGNRYCRPVCGTRMIEAFGFLSARTRLKIDASFPASTAVTGSRQRITSPHAIDGSG
ncbi:hypothetical protein KCP70_17430 [Salmonella enterica subsp. enterica]|nr:hypothetical protein KCP70_17430 [Salmonella enterica subsp. enterica]